jgi:transposase
MKTPDIFDLYTDYLITSFSHTTATGLSGSVDNTISHDPVTRFLSQQDFTSKELGKVIKKTVREIVFSNQSEGWKALISWPQKNTQEGTDQLHFVMEATGVYHENFASWLYGQGASVSVVNPAYVKYYAPGIGVRTKNDKKDSVVLARYGTKESPLLWQPAPLEVRTLKALLVRLDAVEKDLLRENNRLEKST